MAMSSVCLGSFSKSAVFGLGTTVKLSKVPQTDHNMAKQLSSLDRGLGLDATSNNRDKRGEARWGSRRSRVQKSINKQLQVYDKLSKLICSSWLGVAASSN